MGFKLYREIRDFAPPDWTSGELVVALMIADDASDGTRQSWIPLPLLCARTRLKPSTVREKLAMLAARGYEFRVIHGYGKDGRPVFAARNHATDFRVPDILKGAGTPAPKPVDNPPKGAGVPAAIAGYPQPKGAGNPAEGAGVPAAIGPKGAGVPAPLSSEELLPHISSTTGLMVTSAQKYGGKLSTDPDQINGKCVSKLEAAALRAVAQSRTERGEPA